jgi:spermidine synthase
MVTLATLMEEILLTRIFSVTMWYHFVFLAVSLAMFGLTVGGLVVYVAPRCFAPHKAKKHLSPGAWVLGAGTVAIYLLYLYYQPSLSAVSILLLGLAVGGLVIFLAPQICSNAEVKSLLSAAALGFAVTTILSFLAYRGIRHVFDFTVVGVLSLVTILGAISVPFVFSGLCVCLALTRFPKQVSRLYAADLSGAAMGCILIIYALRFIDAPTTMVFAAALAGVGAFLFAPSHRGLWLRRLTLLCTLLIVAFAAVNVLLARKHKSVLELAWIKGAAAESPIYEKWNSFSRVTVTGNPNHFEEPTGWGLSPAYRYRHRVRQLHMYIDSGAYTVMTQFDGNFQLLDYLKHDITNLAHYLRPNSRVVVIGAGGGRDVLSALAFGQKSVIAIEMNEGILHAINRTFGDFTGHMDRDPRVVFVNDEARSYIARMREPADIIQASLVDTWAATAAGAFALSENSLYTSDAWRSFLEHLTPRGVLTFTRWYDPNRLSETYRLVSLASTALAQSGVENPRDNIVLVLCPRRLAVATILASREPFSSADLDLLDELTHRLQFQILLSPRQAADSTLAKLASGKEPLELVRRMPGRLEAPTDDSPFFFCNFRVREILDLAVGHGRQKYDFGGPVATLTSMVMAVTLLTVLCIIFPLLFSTQRSKFVAATPLFLFFACIGMGYMLVEVSQLQRLMIFLGHPTYSLSTVLFTLLLSSGLGSYSTGNLKLPSGNPWFVGRLLLLLGVLVLFGFLTPYAVAAFAPSSTPVRILVAVAILFPLGFFMGMAFPLGMTVASIQSEALTPWLWGLNGATSVLASVVTFLIVLGCGVMAAFWAGFACYVIAFASYLWAVRGKSMLASRTTGTGRSV